MSTKLKSPDNLPNKPGVYIMRDAGGTIIYVGKAKVLKNRVRQYFHGTDHTPKVAAMISKIEDFEYILTDTEFEALCLESNLIKKHKPRYNILLKDDKGYPFIKITKDAYPRITLARKKEEDGAEYAGETVTMNGSAVIEPATEVHKNGNTNEVKPTMPAPSKEPMASTEEIVEAAYSGIPEEERIYVIKDSANATVTRYADGRQEYEVGFQTTQDKYIKVRLDSELNPIWQGA